MSLSDKRVCRDCGAPLPQENPASTCPRCLLEVCFEEESVYGAPEAAFAGFNEAGEPGERFGDYDLIEEIARGGMGVVYRARQRSLDRIVALKMMLPGRLTSPELVRRFRIEAEAASRLRHPGIVAIHDVGQCEGQHFYSMDYIDGCDLARRVEAGLVAPIRAAAWVRAIAEAIHHAHQHAILHRDLKPANVLIDRQDQPHVTDFGLAKLLDEGRDLTATGRVLGTPGFMPPEQADPDRGLVSVASDVYGLGAIFYFLLTGKGPFEGQSMEHTIKLLLTEDPAPPSRHRPGIPRDLETICLKCLNKEPARRYASAADLAADLGSWARHEPISARPVSRAERVWFWARRNPGLANVSVGLVISVVAGILLQERALNQARRARAAAEGLIQYMNQDLTEQLRPIGRLALLDNVNRTVENYYQGIPMKEPASNSRTGKIQFYQNNAAVLREMGQLEDAQESALAAIALLEPLVRDEPSNGEWASALAEAHGEMRNIFAATDPPAALSHAQEAVRYAGRAYALQPTAEKPLVSLANAHLELASVLQQQKESRQAADEVQVARELLGKLSPVRARQADAQRQVALSSYYQGLVQFDQGKKREARESFADYLDRTARLANDATGSGDSRMLFQLAVAHSHLGRALLDLPDTNEALDHFREYYRLATDLERRDPGNVNYRRELGFSLDWLAVALERAGHAPEEITPLLMRSRDCFQQLANDFPKGDLWQNHAARAATRFAMWQAQHGHRSEAQALLANEVTRRWNLLVQESGRRSNHHRFIAALEWSEEVGGPPDAAPADRLAQLRAWLAKADAEAARPGATSDWCWTRAKLHHQLAEDLARENHFQQAKDELSRALPLWQKLVAERPNDSEAAAGMARALGGISLATMRTEPAGKQLAATRSLITWLKTRQPQSPGIKEVLNTAMRVNGQLTTLAGTRSADEQSTLRDLTQEIERLRR
jgi:tetratricopeptide (TPR) repeat protein/predicted Ser/Thr protein kinase